VWVWVWVWEVKSEGAIGTFARLVRRHDTCWYGCGCGCGCGCGS